MTIFYMLYNLLFIFMIEKIKHGIEYVIFSSKWLLIPFFIKLFVTLIRLLQAFVINGHLSNPELMEALEDVDVVMIACLVKMIITGSYNSFVSKKHGYEGEDVSSGLLKVKMATSIVGVTTIHLLQSFVSAETVQWDVIYKQSFMHGLFILGAISLALIDFIHHKTSKH